MTDAVRNAEVALVYWANISKDRDNRVRRALEVGISKHRIHALSGISRTTLDRIVKGSTMANLNEGIDRAWEDRIGAYVQKRLTQAGVDWDAIDLTVSPSGTATLELRDGTKIALGEEGPDEHSEAPYWMATRHDVDGSQDLIFDGSEGEQVLWTRLAERIRG